MFLMLQERAVEDKPAAQKHKRAKISLLTKLRRVRFIGTAPSLYL